MPQEPAASSPSFSSASLDLQGRKISVNTSLPSPTDSESASPSSWALHSPIPPSSSSVSPFSSSPAPYTSPAADGEPFLEPLLVPAPPPGPPGNWAANGASYSSQEREERDYRSGPARGSYPSYPPPPARRMSSSGPSSFPLSSSLPPFAASTDTHAIKSILSAQMEEKLQSELTNRHTPAELVGKGILLDQRKAASIQLAQRAILRQLDRDRLSEFLANRPTMEQLIQANQNLLEDTMTWTRQVTNGAIPIPRNCHTMSLAPELPPQGPQASQPPPSKESKLYLLGGYGPGQQQAELLVFSPETNTWSRPVVAGVLPCDRYSHTCSTVGSQLILFGGFSASGQWLNDLHVLDTDFVQPFYPKLSKPSQPKPLNMLMWYQPQTHGQPPCPRAAHTATVLGDQVYVFGGNDGKQLFNDLFVLDIKTMTWRQPKQFGFVPSPRAGHTANAIGPHKLLVFGGGNANGPVNDLFILDVETMSWSCPQVRGTPPSPRTGHTASFIFGNQLLVFAGGYLNKVYNDLHLFHIDSLSWSRPSDTGTLPIPRAGHTATLLGSKIYTFAGGDADDVFNDLHILDVAFLRTESVMAQRKQLPVASSMPPSPPPPEGRISRRRSLSDLNLKESESEQLSFSARQEQLRAAEEHLVLSNISSLSERVDLFFSQCVKTMDSRLVDQSRQYEEMARIIKQMESSSKKQAEKAREDLRLLQQTLLGELEEFKESFLRSRSQAGRLLGRMKGAGQQGSFGGYSGHSSSSVSPSGSFSHPLYGFPGAMNPYEHHQQSSLGSQAGFSGLEFIPFNNELIIFNPAMSSSSSSSSSSSNSTNNSVPSSPHPSHQSFSNFPSNLFGSAVSSAPSSAPPSAPSYASSPPMAMNRSFSSSSQERQQLANSFINQLNLGGQNGLSASPSASPPAVPAANSVSLPNSGPSSSSPSPGGSISNLKPAQLAKHQAFLQSQQFQQQQKQISVQQYQHHKLLAQQQQQIERERERNANHKSGNKSPPPNGRSHSGSIVKDAISKINQGETGSPRPSFSSSGSSPPPASFPSVKQVAAAVESRSRSTSVVSGPNSSSANPPAWSKLFKK